MIKLSFFLFSFFLHAIVHTAIEDKVNVFNRLVTVLRQFISDGILRAIAELLVAMQLVIQLYGFTQLFIFDSVVNVESISIILQLYSCCIQLSCMHAYTLE